jgi:tetratricopeptide (TPR) repeat protein
MDNLLVRGVALRNLAQISREYEKNFDQAEELYEEALSIFHQLDEKRWIAICYGGLGVLMLLQHDIAQAEHYLIQAQALNKQLNEIEGIASSTSDLARVALEQGDFDKVEALLNQSLQLAYDYKLPEEEAYAKVWLARLRERQSRKDEAFKLADETYQIYERVGLHTPIVNEAKHLRDHLSPNYVS